MLVWARSTKGSGDADILMRDPSAPGGAREILKGEGAMSPEAVSPDGKTVLLGRYLSISESRRWLLDVASGQLTPLGVGKGKIAYAGGQFTQRLATQGRERLLHVEECAQCVDLGPELGHGRRGDLDPVQEVLELVLVELVEVVQQREARGRGIAVLDGAAVGNRGQELVRGLGQRLGVILDRPGLGDDVDELLLEVLAAVDGTVETALGGIEGALQTLDHRGELSDPVRQRGHLL